MTTITAVESITLDGVLQAPGRSDEDTRGGFEHGGWSQGYDDQVLGSWAADGMGASGGMVFGHRSYLDLLTAWTARSGNGNPFSDHLTAATKYVCSHSPDTELDFPNSTLLAGEAVETVAALRDGVDGDLTILGSLALVCSLHAAGLIDRYTLLTYPIVLGAGTRLFGPGEQVDLRLERTLGSTTGVIISEYAVVHPGAPRSAPWTAKPRASRAPRPRRTAPPGHS